MIKTQQRNATKDHLERSYVWALYNMLPDFGYFSIEIVDYSEGEIIDELSFSKNTEGEEGRKDLFRLLGNYPDTFRKLESEFDFGFGFDLRIRVFI